MNTKKKNLIFNIVKLALFITVFLFLVIPQINPFLTDKAKDNVSEELKKYFGMIADDPSNALFTPAKLITALSVAIFVYLLTTVICFVIKAVLSRKNRSKTVAGLLSSIIKVIGAVAGIVWVLSVLGVNLAAIFASLGVVSLILGFGVQSLIEDCVTGIFIIIEGQYNIGDIIVLEDFRGTVQKISMRTTTICDGGGNLKIINNSDIRNIQNRSNNKSVAICDVGISYDARLKDVEDILQNSFEQIYENNKDIFDDAPKYAGVQSLANSSVVLRITVSVAENNIFPATRRLNREIKMLFDDNGIEIPFNQLVVHNSEK